MVGATLPSEAEPGTIRGDLAISDGYNLVHGSDSPEAAATEIDLFFAEGEIVDWEACDKGWVYDVASDLR